MFRGSGLKSSSVMLHCNIVNLSLEIDNNNGVAIYGAQVILPDFLLGLALTPLKAIHRNCRFFSGRCSLTLSTGLRGRVGGEKPKK